MPVGVSGNRGEGQSNGSQPPGMDNGSTQAAVADGAQEVRALRSHEGEVIGAYRQENGGHPAHPKIR